MVQSLNLAAIRTTARVILREPALALPHAHVRDIGELDFAKLRAAGCRGVVFDKDNTLTAPYANEVYPRLAGALRSCVQTFGAERVAVLSNSAGTPDDPGGVAADTLQVGVRVEVRVRVRVSHLPLLHRLAAGGPTASAAPQPSTPTLTLRGIAGDRAPSLASLSPNLGLAPQAALGVHVLRRRHKKPRGFESVRKHFGCDGTELVMVGDRYLTDVTFGNLHGMLTVHTEQLTTVGDNRVAQQMRRIEDWLVARYVRQGVRAPPHPLALRWLGSEDECE